MTSNTSNLEICNLYRNSDIISDKQYLISACTEVVNLINSQTNEIEYKIYDKEAQYGFVTCLKSSANLLAVGYSSGTIVVYDLNLQNIEKDIDNQNQEVFL